MNQFLPAIAYGIFLIATAVRIHRPHSALSAFVVICLVTAVLTLLLYRKINFSNPERRTSLLKQWLDNTFQKSFVQFFVERIMREQPGLIISTKCFGCLLIFGICQLYRFDQFDHRLLGMGCLVAWGPTLAIVFQYTLFEHHTFSMIRNLPMPLYSRMFNFLLTMVVISFPETIFLVRNFPSQLDSFKLLEMVVFCFSILTFGYSFLLRKHIGLEAFSRYIFISALALILLILFKVPLLLMTAVATAMTVYWYHTGFYKFEIIVERKGAD